MRQIIGAQARGIGGRGFLGLRGADFGVLPPPASGPSWPTTATQTLTAASLNPPSNSQRGYSVGTYASLGGDYSPLGITEGTLSPSTLLNAAPIGYVASLTIPATQNILEIGIYDAVADASYDPPATAFNNLNFTDQLGNVHNFTAASAIYALVSTVGAYFRWTYVSHSLVLAGGFFAIGDLYTLTFT